jgi:putative flippase GtrA
MTYPFGGDSSKYSYVSLAVSFLVSVLLAFVWREQLVYRDRDSTRLRRFLMTASLWTASVSAIGQVAFSSYRWFHAPDLGVHHNGPALVFAISGLVISLISLLSVFAVGSKRWLAVLSSLVMTIVWFLAVLDNINW